MTISSSKTRRGRRPDPAIDEELRRALVELFAERGVELTYDEVAARAGIGRASVFRRFPTKSDLIQEAAAQLVIRRLDAPDTGSFRGDLIALISGAIAIVGDQRYRAALRQAHSAAFRDEAVAAILRNNLEGRRGLFAEITARAITRGEIDAETDSVLVADLVSGLVLLRLAALDAVPDREEVERLAGVLVDGMGPVLEKKVEEI